MENLKVELEDALRPHIAPAELVQISLSDDVDADGDAVLRMRAVYDDRTGALSADKVFSSYGLIHDLLLRRQDKRFPLLTYVSLDEYDEAAA